MKPSIPVRRLLQFGPVGKYLAPAMRLSVRSVRLAALLLALGTAQVAAHGLSAEELLEVAVSRADSGGPAAEDSVASLLTMIETEHPDSSLGLRITLLRSQGISNIDILATLRGTQPADAGANTDERGTVESRAEGIVAPRAVSEAGRNQQIEALYRQAMSASGPARADALTDLLALMEQTALEYPNGEVAWRLRQDDAFQGAHHGSIRRELAALRASNGFAGDRGGSPGGGDPIAPASEFDEQAIGLADSERREIQGRLTSLGHDTRGVDGRFGPRTRGAITEWQQSAGIPATGFLSRNQFDRLRGDSAESYPRWQEQQRARSTPTRAPSRFTHPRRSAQQTLADARSCGANVVLFTISIPPGRVSQVVNCMRNRGYRAVYR